ncbi:MAG: SusD/RagB family nutrient-binding outer membrane lipoprotein [Ginsengibacter sp.]
MKTLSRKIFLGTSILLLLFISGCDKHLDINVDPNNPSLDQGTPLLVFPVGVMAVAGAAGGQFGILGAIWGQYTTQAALSNQYKTIDAYQITKSDLNGAYSLLYTRGLKNFQFVIDKAGASADWNFYLMGMCMKAYATTILVDLYDQIPYSEALKGASNLSPKFDDGYSIYKDLLTNLDAALANDFGASTNTNAGSADLVFGGDMDKWKEFAYTLELKMYLRMVNAKPDEASAGIEKLIDQGAPFLTEDAGVYGFTDAPGVDNPLFEQNSRSLNTTNNLRASVTFTSYLKQNSDTPRLQYYFGSNDPSAINQGDYAGTDPSYGTAAVYNPAPTDPVIFISLAETYFMQAEADLRYLGAANTKSLYDNGVWAAFASTGNDGTPYTEAGAPYEYPSAGTVEDQIKAISTQKWASCAYGVHFLEGYFEKNRTGYPLTSPVYSTAGTYVPGEFVTSANSALAAGKLPERLIFPDLERQTNSNTPAEVALDVPVWWAK